MAGQRTREVVFHACVEDAYDGPVRLLGDAQRFGLGLRAMHLEAGEDGSSLLTLTLEVPEHIDEALLASRFARHPVVRRVAVGQPWTDAELVEPRQLAA